jgi:UPF0271 protein
MPRTQDGAVLHDAEQAAERALAMVTEGALIAASGQRIPVPIHSICVHGDSPGAVGMAKAVRQRLEAAGVALKPFASV